MKKMNYKKAISGSLLQLLLLITISLYGIFVYGLLTANNIWLMFYCMFCGVCGEIGLNQFMKYAEDWGNEKIYFTKSDKIIWEHIHEKGEKNEHMG